MLNPGTNESNQQMFISPNLKSGWYGRERDGSLTRGRASWSIGSHTWFWTPFVRLKIARLWLLDTFFQHYSKPRAIRYWASNSCKWWGWGVYKPGGGRSAAHTSTNSFVFSLALDERKVSASGSHSCFRNQASQRKVTEHQSPQLTDRDLLGIR